MSIGLCIPNVCKVSDFNDYKPYLVPLLNSIIPEVFEGIKGFDLQIKISNEDLMFENSEAKNKEITRGNAVSWMIVLLSFFFIFSMILSSFASWYFKKENEKR